MEVLKDADATAIYGSRGANGSSSLQPKKAKAGKAKFSVNIYNGFSRVARSMDFKYPQYLLMRKEALANDGLIPNAVNAPDLVLWDTSRYSNLKKLLIGNTAHTQDWQASLSAGTVNTQILISMAYNQQTNVFPGNLPYKRGSAHLNLSHKPASAKWDIQFSAIYAADKNNLLRTDLTKYLTLPPNIKLKEADGSLTWQDAGVTYSSLGFSNPFAELLQQYEAQTTNLSANLQFSVTLTKELKFRLSSGYNRLTTDETNIVPKTSIAPRKQHPRIFTVCSGSKK
ncbi:MAG: hypothetical protein IPK31_07145 [Chitinophagaceae bacterium]|nr:hypothetical protein [Chitinophagaceae bacterium]